MIVTNVGRDAVDVKALARAGNAGRVVSAS
jgi:hypothetical protein